MTPRTQPTLPGLELPPMPTVRLAEWDLVCVSTSGGKDSQTALALVADQARREGVLDRVVAVHADLGRVEWQGVRELAEQQARAHGVRFLVVRRDQEQDLLAHVEARGQWPGPATRYCTADHKRAPIRKLWTSLVAAEHKRLGRRVRVLHVMGLRADESPGRRKLSPLALDEGGSNGRREVWTWLPLHRWTVEQVWTDIRARGVPHHAAYDAGMPRLSCVFCIYADRPALMLAGKLNRDLLDAYVDVEQRTGHSFKVERERGVLVHLRLADIRDALDAGEEPGEVASWAM